MNLFFEDPTSPGQAQLRWMWLPTFIGMDAGFLTDLEVAANASFAGKVLDEEVHTQLNRLVIGRAEARYPDTPVRQLLTALLQVPLGEDQDGAS